MSILNVGIIGLDTIHPIHFTRMAQAPECDKKEKAEGIRITSCMAFKTPFISSEELGKRIEQMRKWGVNVTGSFEETVDGCDAVMVSINDPSYHLEYMQACAKLKKPVFLDKPLADNINNGEKIFSLVRKHNLKFFSASSLRFRPQLLEACKKMENPLSASVYGPFSQAPAGSSIVWYGVHTFEMLERIMGTGALSVKTERITSGAVCIVEYPEGKHGIVELSANTWGYSGSLRYRDDAVQFVVDSSTTYIDMLKEVKRFFETGVPPVSLEDTLEVMAMLDAAEHSYRSGEPARMPISKNI